ncbi:HalD/BesD family halogenase [Streptomyces hydrogenans]|uniref:HalD/BesD family halogenase n=1 Tax=Streptomyces hydrogenans TaxID=1873719 RepID=UPI0036CDC277
MPSLLDADVLTRLGPDGADRFTRDGYLALPGLLTGEGLAVLGREATGLEAVARRRDFAMACMDDSPRHMTTLGGHVIGRASTLIPALYRDRSLMGLVREVAGEPVIEVDDPVERHVLNILHRAGDTHGAHTDDHPYALVLFLEAPDDPADGGLVRYLPRAASLRTLDSGRARTAHHRAGEAYLLRSDTTAHRVTPLVRPGLRRTVLNFAYTTPVARPQRTPSATELYE